MTGVARAIRLLILDHSPGARERLRAILDDTPDIDVVGDAGTVEKALRLLDELHPSVILVDCDLPRPGSFAAVKEMMSLYPVPIVMITKQGKAAVSALESRALETGAVALAAWTPGDGRGTPGGGDELIRTVRAMSEVKVVRRREQRAKAPASSPDSRSNLTLLPVDARVEIVAMGASTGGPPVLQAILGGLSRPLTVPILLVQHLSPGFHSSLLTWLSDATGARIRLGEHGMPTQPGTVYLAPDDRHMGIDSSGRLVLSDGAPENGSRPSVSYLFRSVADSFGSRSIAVLLTGMGRDGAKELRQLRDKGAVTIAQDEETSVVHGMPGEAIKLKGARYVLPPDRIPSVLEHHVGAFSSQREQGSVPLSAC